MTVGNLLQQFYNIADTLVVGRVLGRDALAAVGSAYTLMVFLTSVLIGLCMGSGVSFSISFGAKNDDRLKSGIFHSFVLISALTLLLTILSFAGTDLILRLLNVPDSVAPLMSRYLLIVFAGIPAVFIYNFFTALLRAVGNSVSPLIFLGVSSVLNIILDILLVVVLPFGIRGAAAATVAAQFVSAAGIAVYTLKRFPELRPSLKHMRWQRRTAAEITSFSLFTCLQQSVMNLGILMVQGIVNSFGSVVMAAFAAAVKIDSFAYMPVQDFGNAFSTFAAQNYGAGEEERIRKGIRSALTVTILFSLAVSILIFLFAAPLMGLFVQAGETDIIAAGVSYLRIEGSFYLLIGILFLWYGFYRAVEKPYMSLILTVISLGTRVFLSYTLSSLPSVGVTGIWISVPVGWLLADLTGLICYLHFLRKRKSR